MARVVYNDFAVWVGEALRDEADFLAIWKDADSDLPILIQARQEYAKLVQ